MEKTKVYLAQSAFESKRSFYSRLMKTICAFWMEGGSVVKLTKVANDESGLDCIEVDGCLDMEAITQRASANSIDEV